MSENGTSTEIVEAFDHAQRDAIRLLGDVIRQLEVGMSEIDIGELAEHRAQAYGFSGWFHPPEIRFDGNLQRNHKPSHRKTLKAGTLVEVDLGPATDLAFGDVGVSLAFGQEDQPRLVQDARELCVATCGFANRGKCVGELFVFADAYARNRSMSLGDSKAVGHRCFPREGWTATAWPKMARAAIYMRRNQIQWFNPRRMLGIFAIRPRLVKDQQGLAFEEMVFIDGDSKRLLGRNSVEEIGTW